MNTLSSLQEAFQNYLLSSQMNIAQSVIETNAISCQTRLNIYRNAYQVRLKEALSSNFPCLNVYLGEEVFHQLSIDYIKLHSSPYRSIRWYGDKLAIFLKNYYDMEYVSELADFEWNIGLLFDAADAPPFSLEQMTSIPSDAWGAMQFKANPSLRRLNLSWNVAQIWQALVEEQEPLDACKNSEALPWVLWRTNYMNQFYVLEEDEAWAMDSMLKGQSFGEICEGLCRWHDEEAVGMRAAMILKTWIESGIITELCNLDAAQA